MLKEFEKYLEQKGYSRITPSGNPSTTADYPKRIEMVARLEQITIDEVVSRLETLIKEYDAGGIKEEWGRRSHNAVICALKRFKEFIKSLDN